MDGCYGIEVNKSPNTNQMSIVVTKFLKPNFIGENITTMTN